MKTYVPVTRLMLTLLLAGWMISASSCRKKTECPGPTNPDMEILTRDSWTHYKTVSVNYSGEHETSKNYRWVFTPSERLFIYSNVSGTLQSKGYYHLVDNGDKKYMEVIMDGQNRKIYQINELSETKMILEWKEMSHVSKILYLKRN